jgi:hypothetical protein
MSQLICQILFACPAPKVDKYTFLIPAKIKNKSILIIVRIIAHGTRLLYSGEITEKVIRAIESQFPGFL